jgi:hypothetical protein
MACHGKRGQFHLSICKRTAQAAKPRLSPNLYATTDNRPWGTPGTSVKLMRVLPRKLMAQLVSHAILTSFIHPQHAPLFHKASRETGHMAALTPYPELTPMLIHKLMPTLIDKQTPKLKRELMTTFSQHAMYPFRFATTSSSKGGQFDANAKTVAQPDANDNEPPLKPPFRGHFTSALHMGSAPTLAQPKSETCYLS